MVLKVCFKQQNMAGKHMPPHVCFDEFQKQKSYPFAVLPVCMQEFLIFILELPFAYFVNFYVPL